MRSWVQERISRVPNEDGRNPTLEELRRALSDLGDYEMRRVHRS